VISTHLVKDTYLDLINRVVQMAEGVFLWARLVVRSLLSSLARHDPPRALQDKLNAVPKDLNALYDRLLNSVDHPNDRKRANKMLLITAHNPLDFRLNALCYTWLDDLEDPGFPLANSISPYSVEEVNRRLRQVQLQLDGLTRGLLEMVPYNDSCWRDSILASQSVEFFHRTARDFVLERLRHTTNQAPGFLEIETYARLAPAELKVYPTDCYPSSDLNKGTVSYHTNLISQILSKLRSQTSGHQELPLHLFEAFKQVISIRNTYHPYEPNFYFVPACKIDRISFVHFAAY
jgi:hypothetical protein